MDQLIIYPELRLETLREGLYYNILNISIRHSLDQTNKHTLGNVVSFTVYIDYGGMGGMDGCVRVIIVYLHCQPQLLCTSENRKKWLMALFCFNITGKPYH